MSNLNTKLNEELEVKEIEGLEGFDSMGGFFNVCVEYDDSNFDNELDIDVDADDEILIDLDGLE